MGLSHVLPVAKNGLWIRDSPVPVEKVELHPTLADACFSNPQVAARANRRSGRIEHPERGFLDWPLNESIWRRQGRALGLRFVVESARPRKLGLVFRRTDSDTVSGGTSGWGVAALPAPARTLQSQAQSDLSTAVLTDGPISPIGILSHPVLIRKSLGGPKLCLKSVNGKGIALLSKELPT